MFTFCRIALLVLLLLLMSGCAAKLPRMVQLSESDYLDAKHLLITYQEAPSAKAVDADASLHWDSVFGKGTADIMLKMRDPGLLRLSVADPLGRALVILVADQQSFTLADIRKVHAYTGALPSTFLQQYIPKEITPSEIFYLLGARLSPELRLVDIGGAADGQGYWYSFLGDKNFEHRIYLNLERGLPAQYIVLDSEKKEKLWLHYSNFITAPDQSYWPGTVVITARGVTGTYELVMKKIYTTKVKPRSSFSLPIPAHFAVEQVM